MTTAKLISERQLQATVIDLAKAYGWRYYHTYDSRRSPEGFPDLVLLRVDSSVETYLWRPSDLLNGEIEKILAARTR